MRCERAIEVQIRKSYDFWEAQHTTFFRCLELLQLTLRDTIGSA